MRLARALDDLADQVRIAQHQARRAPPPLGARGLAETDGRPPAHAGRRGRRVGARARRERSGLRSGARRSPDQTDARHRDLPRSTPTTDRSAVDRAQQCRSDRLRQFAAAAQAQDGATEQDLVRVRNAWAGFRDRCGWVPVEAPPLPGGFGEYLDENAEDARWAVAVADAFEAAGGGSVADVALDVAGASTLPPAAQRLLDPSLTPAQVAAAWKELGLTAEDIAALPLRTQVQVANLDGVPAVARDVASRRVLAVAIRDPERLYRLFGWLHVRRGEPRGVHRTGPRARSGLQRADKVAADLPAPTVTVAQLVGFGVANGAPVAAVVLGDLDTAENVTVNVPGATTTLDSTLQKVRAASGLLNSAARLQGSTSFAVVSWFGYRAPALPESRRRAEPPRVGPNWRPSSTASTTAEAGHRVDSRCSATRTARRPQRKHWLRRDTASTPNRHLRIGRLHGRDQAGAPQRRPRVRDGRTGGPHRHQRQDRPDRPTRPAGRRGLQLRSGERPRGRDRAAMYPETAGQVGYLTPGSTAQDTISQIVATGGRG